MTSQSLPPFDLAAAFRLGNPYPAYTTYRTREPLHIVRDEDDHARNAFLFGHADCMKWLRDPRVGTEWRKLYKDAPLEQRPPDPEPGSFQDVSTLFMLFRDPPTHTRLRGVANMAFTPRQVEKLRSQIEIVASDLAHDIRDTGGEVDLITHFAFPLPMLVIAEVLGIPSEDFRSFRSLAGDIAAAIDFPVDELGEFVARVDRSTMELSEYLRRLIATRRVDPRDDLLSQLIHAESDQGRLSEQELVATCILLLVAGHETTVNLIGNGILALMRQREQWSHLVAESNLAKNATEELLRYDAPVQVTTRTVFESIDLSGADLHRGAQLTFVLGSANRDESVFEDAGRLDIRREVGRIMSFGMGIHFCLGAPLARMEGEIAFATLAREFPDLDLVSTEVEWRPGVIFHGLKELPVSIG